MTFHHILMMNIDGFTRFTPCCRVHVRCDPFAEHKEPCRFVDYIVVKVEGSQKEMLCDLAWVAGEAYFRAIRGELSPSLACRRPEVAGEGVD